ncbi:hypothetical protein K1X84_02470 [bacterium]|nr:hypothetical protein [bacterium]
MNIASYLTQRGSIYFWKYKTDGWLGSEWHFTANAVGWNFFVELLNQIERSDSDCTFLISTKAVTQKILRVPDFNSPYENRDGLRLTYSPFESNYYEWSLSDNEHIVDISFGKAILHEWRRVMTESEERETSIGLEDDHTIFVWRIA